MRQMWLGSAEVGQDGILKVVYQGRQIRLAAFGVHWKAAFVVFGIADVVSWFCGFASFLFHSLPSLLDSDG